MTNDFFHGLIRDRAILAEALLQQTMLRKEAMNNGTDPRPFIVESERLVVRLMKVQTEIERSNLDD